MSLSKFVACICEGSAEQTVIRKLLDNDRLIFTYDDLIEEDVLRCRGAKDFEDRHLRKGFTKKITVYRILDSRRENFKLSKAYVEKVDVVNIITAPELEMLVILAEDKYADFKKYGKKPSLYCKEKLKYRDIKSAKFVGKYFSDVDVLIAAIKEYKRVSDIPKGEQTLADLLK